MALTKRGSASAQFFRQYFIAQETEDDQQIPLLRHLGAMSSHLNPLICRFTKPNHLSIRKVGQDDSASENWSEPREKERHIQLSNFLKSVHSTITTLVF